MATTHSAYNMFSWYKYLIVNLVFSHLSSFAPFPDLCLLVLFFNLGTLTLRYMENDKVALRIF